jgi:hypothetical protein
MESKSIMTVRTKPESERSFQYAELLAVQAFEQLPGARPLHPLHPAVVAPEPFRRSPHAARSPVCLESRLSAHAMQASGVRSGRLLSHAATGGPSPIAGLQSLSIVELPKGYPRSRRNGPISFCVKYFFSAGLI